jgi:hypothetical protein
MRQKSGPEKQQAEEAIIQTALSQQIGALTQGEGGQLFYGVTLRRIEPAAKTEISPIS